MNGIIDLKIRNEIKEHLNFLNKELRYVNDRCIGISDLEELIKYERKIRRDSKKIITQNLSVDISIAEMSIICCFFITKSIFNEDEPNSLFPFDWVHPDGKPNPNTVIGCLMTQIVIFSISIIELIEKGLDNGARALTRTLIEITWQTLILLSSRNDMNAYVSPNSHDEAQEAWFRLFGKGKLQKKLLKTENMLNINETLKTELRKNRQLDFNFFSQSVHNAYATSAIQSFVWDFDSDNGHWSAFGGASFSSKITLELLNSNLFYFIHVFFSIVIDIHGILPNKSDKYFWKEAVILRDCITKVTTAE